MKTIIMNQNEQNYLELKKRFQNETDEGNGNEEGFGNGNEPRNELESRNENGSRNEHQINFNICCGNELDDTVRNELAEQLTRDFKGETVEEELIHQMNKEILFFCSNEQFFQDIFNNDLANCDGIHIVTVTRKNIVSLLERYCDTVEYYLRREYIRQDEVESFEKAVTRLDKLVKCYREMGRTYNYNYVKPRDGGFDGDAEFDDAHIDDEISILQKLKQFLYGE